MKLYTIFNGVDTDGIRIDKGHLRGSLDEYPVVYYGESTGGCRQQMLVKLNQLQMRSLRLDGKITVKTGIIKQSIRNNPILDTRLVSRDNSSIICFIVGGTAKGGVSGEIKVKYFDGERTVVEHYPFPGEVIHEGFIWYTVDGERTKLETKIAIIKKDTIFSIAIDSAGYLYQNTLYYRWDGKKLSKYSWAEMEIIFTP